MSRSDKARLASVLTALGHAVESGYAWSVYPSEAKTLLAEIERLRAEAELLRTGREATRCYADRVEAEVLALRAEAGLLQQEARIHRGIGDGLVAEVEAARTEAATMRTWAEEAAKAENENAEDAKRERAAVVAWIRRVAKDARDWSEHADVYDAIADNIESGEHRREGDE